MKKKKKKTAGIDCVYIYSYIKVDVWLPLQLIEPNSTVPIAATPMVASQNCVQHTHNPSR